MNGTLTKLLVMSHPEHTVLTSETKKKRTSSFFKDSLRCTKKGSYVAPSLSRRYTIVRFHVCKILLYWYQCDKVILFSNIVTIGGKLNFQNIGKTKLRMSNKNGYITKPHNRTICALYISNNLVSTYDLVYSRSSTIFGLTSVFAFWNSFS